MDKSDPRYDRCYLHAGRLEGIASDIRNVAGLPSPLNRVLSKKHQAKRTENFKDISSFWGYRSNL